MYRESPLYRDYMTAARAWRQHKHNCRSCGEEGPGCDSGRRAYVRFAELQDDYIRLNNRRSSGS